MNCSGVYSLLQLSIWKIVEDVNLYIDEIGCLPHNLKKRLLNVMSKRGLITDANIDLLLIEDMRRLDLSQSDVTDVALCEVSRKCHNLCSINLNSLGRPRIGISSAGIAQLAEGCKKLQGIHLNHCVEVSDEGLEDLLESCQYLRKLNLGRCPLVTDLTLKAVGRHCTGLVSINLSRTSITDDGIFKMIAGQCGEILEEVHIDNCINLTDDSVSALVNFCPKLTTLNFHNCPNITEESRLEFENLRGDKKMHITFTVY